VFGRKDQVAFDFSVEHPMVEQSPPQLSWHACNVARFALVRPFKSHSLSLCGLLDPLPRRTTFGFRNTLHLLEARDSVADVRGSSGSLRCLGKANLVADIRSRAGLVSLATIFLPWEHSLLHGGPEPFYRVGLWQLFQLLARGLVDVFFSRGFSHAGLIHFLFDAS
jgi:hypothetical protein